MYAYIHIHVYRVSLEYDILCMAYATFRMAYDVLHMAYAILHMADDIALSRQRPSYDLFKKSPILMLEPPDASEAISLIRFL